MARAHRASGQLIHRQAPARIIDSVLILSLFALLAGAGTAVSPCVLPILPALLSAGAVGGRRRPLGIVVGLALTFWLTVVGFASAVGSSGLGHSALRTLAIVMLAGFGAVLLVPALAARIEAPLSRLARLGPRTRGEGFWSGVGVGGALGFVYLPCAGPILAAVIAVSASKGPSLRTVVIAAAYALGSAVVLLGLALGGRRLFARVRRGASGPGLGRAVGVVMLLTAAVMVAGLDDRLRTALAGTTLGDPARALESSHAAATRLASLGGRARFAEPATPAEGASTSAVAMPGVPTPALTVLGPAPDFTGTQRWFNTPGGSPLSLAALRGRVVLVDFWTYTCINCLRTLPYLTAWDQRYRNSGLTIVGVHTPEFDFEHDAGNVAAAVRDHGIHYPVAQDNDYATWNAWGNQYWPAEYLIDAVGNVRHVSLGEGDYASSEAAIRTLLVQAGHPNLPPPVHVSAVTPSEATQTPETYLDPARGKGWTPPLTAGTRTYRAPEADPGTNRFGLGGSWLVRKEGSVAGRGARIEAGVAARRTYLVLSPPAGGTGRVGVELDGRPVGPQSAGTDAPGGVVSVDRQRLYELVDLPRVQRRHLTLRLSPGTAAYSFTFG